MKYRIVILNNIIPELFAILFSTSFLPSHNGNYNIRYYSSSSLFKVVVFLITSQRSGRIIVSITKLLCHILFALLIIFKSTGLNPIEVHESLLGVHYNIISLVRSSMLLPEPLSCKELLDPVL